MATKNLGKVAFVFKDDYTDLTLYQKYDVVFDGESSFISTANDNSGKALSDTNYWKYLCRGNYSTLNSHISNTNNPHTVTKAQVGLGNVNNTSDADKPISTAQQTALNLKADKARQVIAGSGLTGGGTLESDRTINVTATDDSIIVAADGIKVDTQNLLTSTSATKPLAANQGKILNDSLIQLGADLNQRTIIESLSNYTYIRNNKRLTSAASYVTDENYDILSIPVIAGQTIHIKGKVNNVCTGIFSNNLTSIGSDSYISTIFQTNSISEFSVDVTMVVPSGATYARIPKAKTLPLELYVLNYTLETVLSNREKIINLENVVGERQNISLDNYIITPNSLYSVCNDLDINRNYSANVYLSHLINGSFADFKNKRIGFANFKKSLFLNSPFTIDPTYNGGNVKSETIISETIKSECEYIDKQISFKHRSTLASISKNIIIKHLLIGDSVSNGYLANYNKNPITLPNQYFSYVKMLFEMDKIDGGDNANEYNFIALGSVTSNPFNLSYKNITARSLRSFGVAKGGASIQDVRTSTWGSPAVSNPLYDSVSGDFSIASYINKYRTLDDNGSRLYFDNLGSTTGVGGSKGYIYNGSAYILSDVNIGTEITNTLSYDVCTPDSISIQLSQNSSLTQFQNNIPNIISIIKNELPNVKIILMVNDAVCSYFPEEYPEYKEADITQSNGFSSHLSNLSIFNYLKTTIENEVNNIYVLANLFTAPDAKSCPTVVVNSSDSIGSNEIIQFNNQLYGLGTYAHPNNKAHSAWGYQLYSLLKYINS